MPIDTPASPVPSFRVPTAAELASLALGLGAPVIAEVAPDCDGELIAVRQGYTLEHRKGPTEGRRVHAFEDFDSFADWLNRHAKPDLTEILVDVDSASANLQPSFSNADLVTCPLLQHPRFARWAALLGKQLTQADFHRFIVSCPEDFTLAKTTDGKPLGSYGPILAGAVSKLRIQADASYEVELDDRGFAHFQASTSKTTLQGELPPRFGVKVPMFLGIMEWIERDGEQVPGWDAEYDLEIHLRVIPNDRQAPTFQLSCPGLEVVRRQARIDAVKHLRGKLEKGFLVGLGRLSVSSRPSAHVTTSDGLSTSLFGRAARRDHT